MHSIESLKLDFDSRIRELNKIDNEKIFEECIYVGSGDSYVAGLIAEFLTNHKCSCYSPSDLTNSTFLQDKTYCFVSVTGRTKANIEIATRATKSGIKTVAVTLNENSKLAQVCKQVVPLKITKVNTATAGFSTFVANVVTCLQLAGIFLPKKFNTWYKKGLKLSLSSLDSVILPDETSYILGNNLFYALALYYSFQMAEFFGSTVIAHKLEEFCHSPIFGVNKFHYLWLLGQKEEQLSKRLEKLGFRLSYFELYNSDILTQLFESIFFIQNLILLLANKYGYTELQYVKMKDVLKASSDIIYGQVN
jgi:fructoselysine-6-P-deglycase FrlB-like protein